jgi:hypothetical protein
MKKIDVDGLTDYLAELFSSDNTIESLQNEVDSGLILMRELIGEQTDDLNNLTKAVKEEMPADLLSLMMKIAVTTENEIVPDSSDEERIKNLVLLSGALITMASMTMRFLEIENNVDGLTID